MSNQRKSRSKTNQPIGTIITYRGAKLEICSAQTESYSKCVDCYFDFEYSTICSRIKCGTKERSDNKSVYFKQIPA